MTLPIRHGKLSLSGVGDLKSKLRRLDQKIVSKIDYLIDFVIGLLKFDSFHCDKIKHLDC